MNTSFWLVLRNALRNKRRTLFTVASVAFFMGLLGVFFALYWALFGPGESSPAQAKRLIIHHRVSLTQDLPPAYQQSIAQVPGVDGVTPWRWFGGVYRDAREPRNRFAQFGVDPGELFKVYPECVLPGSQRQAFEKQQTACIAGSALASRFHWKLGERITLVGIAVPATLELQLVGVFDTAANLAGSSLNDMLFFNWKYAEEALPVTNPQRSRMQQYHVCVHTADQVPVVAKAIESLFENSPDPVRAESPREFERTFVAFLGNLRLFLGALGGAVAFTLLLVCANSVSLSVRERTREVGVLRTLGFTPGEILSLILEETCLVTGVGGLLGSVLAVALCSGLRAVTAGIPGLSGHIQYSVAAATLTLLVALALGCGSAVIPACAASRRTVVDALRYSG